MKQSGKEYNRRNVITKKRWLFRKRPGFAERSSLVTSWGGRKGEYRSKRMSAQFGTSNKLVIIFSQYLPWIGCYFIIFYCLSLLLWLSLPRNAEWDCSVLLSPDLRQGNSLRVLIIERFILLLTVGVWLHFGHCPFYILYHLSIPLLFWFAFDFFFTLDDFIMPCSMKNTRARHIIRCKITS